jgi:4-amino-4-deoxy-L-arabinose transferase-like glycosyltransferase
VSVPLHFRKKIPTFILLCSAALLSFLRPDIPLQEPQEIRYAEIPRQMLVANSWLVPLLHGEPYLDKPPLLYWLVMVSYSVFGVHDWAARLTACSAAFLTIGVTYLWGRSTIGRRGALLAAMILCLSVRFIYLARMLTMDTLVSLFVVAALAGMHLALKESAFRWRAWLLAAVACGLGLLTKGPVTLVLVFIPVGLFLIMDRRANRPGWGAWALFFLLAAAVAAPWYVAIGVGDPAFARYFFWKHHVERFVTPFDHQEPFWFYLPELLLGMLPWTLLLPGVLWGLCQRNAGPDQSSPSRFFIVSFAWCLLFFSLSGCKRPSYVLPAMPLLALAIGSYLDGFLRKSDRTHFLARPKSGFGFAIVLCGVMAITLHAAGLYAFLPIYSGWFSLRAQVRPLAKFYSHSDIPVACYPRRWDSVSFYLARDDVRAYSMAERTQLLSDLRTAQATLLYVKSAKNRDELVAALPSTCEYVPMGKQGEVRVGIVHRKCADGSAP